MKRKLTVIGLFAGTLIVAAISRAAVTDFASLDGAAAEGVDIATAWRLGFGEVAGVSFVSPRGPLWQLLAWVGALGATDDPARFVGARCAILSLASLAVASWSGWRAGADDRGSLFALVGLGWLVLQHPEETLPSMLALAAILGALRPPEGDAAEETSAGALAGLLAGSAAWIDPGITLGLGASLAGALGLAERGARARVAVTLGTYALLALALAAVVGSSPLKVDWAPEGDGRPAALTLAVVSGLLAAGLHRVDRVAAGWIFAALPLTILGAARGDTPAAYVGSLPVTGALLLASVRLWPRSVLAGSLATLLFLVVTIGWVGHVGMGSAPEIHAVTQAATLLEAPGETPARGDLPRVAQRISRLSGCVVLPRRLAAAALVTERPGPWWPSDRGSGARLAEEIRRARCPWAVVTGPLPGPRIEGADEVFDRADLALAERYAVHERLGPATHLLSLASATVPASRSPLPLRTDGALAPNQALRACSGSSNSSQGLFAKAPRCGGKAAFASPENDAPAALLAPNTGAPWNEALDLGLAVRPTRFELDRSVPLDRVLSIELEDLVGEPTALIVTVRDDGRDVGVARRFPLDHGQALVTPEPRLAWWRWLTRWSSAEPRTWDSVDLSLDRGTATVARVTVLEPIDATRGDAPTRCTTDRALQAPPFARNAAARREGDLIALDPSPPGAVAELGYLAIPCDDTCLVGEVGLLDGAGPSHTLQFEASVFDGGEELHSVRYEIGRGWRKPFELPLHPWSGRELLLRFTARAPGADLRGLARLFSPRLARCSGLPSLVTRLHDEARHEVEHGAPRMIGDTLELPVRERGAPPTEVRVPLQLERPSCLAVEVAAAQHDSWVTVLVGVVEGGRLRRLVRETFGPGDVEVRPLTDRDLRGWTGRKIELYLAAWSTTPHEASGVARLIRPQLHTCGEEPRWLFH